MSPNKKKSAPKSGGINGRDSGINIGGDVMSGNKMAGDATTDAPPPELRLLLLKHIERKADLDPAHKSELTTIVEEIMEEIQKGDAARTLKLGRLLRTTAAIDRDTAGMVLATLSHPQMQIGLSGAVRRFIEEYRKNQ